MRREPSRLTRREDWPELLAEALAARADIPFVWGQHDCCTLACDIVELLTGVDPMASLRGRYHDEAGAEALLAEAGGLADLAARLAREAGLGSCHPAFAQRGDVALVEHGNALALGVVAGDAVAVAGPEGTTFLPRETIRAAWSV